jgi:hypothetical protein
LAFVCSCFSRSLRCSIRSLIWALMAVNFLVRTAFAVSHRFWVLVGCVVIFINFQEPFNFLLYFVNDLLIIEQCVVQVPIVCQFFTIFCCWFLFLMHYDQIECMGLFLFSYICWVLLWVLRYDQFWKMFHGLLRRMCIVQNLDEIFLKHQLPAFDLLCDSILEFLYWFFVWMTYFLVIGRY